MTKEFKPDWASYEQGRKDGAIEEREACAKICDEEHKNPKHYSAVGESKWIGILIRERGKE